MRFLADENFNNDIIRGVLRRVPDAEFTRIQDTEIVGAGDPIVLEYAVENNYIVLTHDVNTLSHYFYERIRMGLPVPGVFLIHAKTSIGEVVDTLEMIILVSDQSEWDGLLNSVDHNLIGGSIRLHV